MSERQSRMSNCEAVTTFQHITAVPIRSTLLLFRVSYLWFQVSIYCLVLQIDAAMCGMSRKSEGHTLRESNRLLWESNRYENSMTYRVMPRARPQHMEVWLLFRTANRRVNSQYEYYSRKPYPWRLMSIIYIPALYRRPHLPWTQLTVARVWLVVKRNRIVAIVASGHFNFMYE